jgi:transcriptional regulator with XRE-family HTH domain
MLEWDTICYRWRTWCRFTQAEAAEQVGVSVVTWGRWERGETVPPTGRQEEALDAMILEKVALDGALADRRAALRREQAG